MVGLISDLLIRISGIRWSLVMGRDNSQLIFSLRTNRWNQNAGRMAQRVAKGLGTAGGHGMAAGGQIPTSGLSLKKEQVIRETLAGRLLRFLGYEKAREEKLLR